LVNSHLLGELELICDRVAILVNGKLAKQGTIDELALGSERYEIELIEHVPVADLGARLGVQWEGPMPPPLPAGPAQGGNGQNQPAFDPRAFSRLPPGTLSPFAARGRLKLSDASIPLAYDPLTRILRLESLELAPATAALDATRRAGLMIRRFTPVRPTLEDLFIATVTPTITATR
jgi:ABC-type multidrug transport system ATPase subunit